MGGKEKSELRQMIEEYGTQNMNDVLSIKRPFELIQV